MPVSSGIHHVTAVCGEPMQAIDFHARVLGLRLVKKTVNFDDPTAWHFYFGDETGSPGSILTFFARPDGAPGQPGAGETVSLAFAIPMGAAAFWIDRFNDEGVPFGVADGGRALAFHNPDGLALELIETAEVGARPGYATDDIASEDAIRGFANVTLLVADAAATARVMTQGLGWTPESHARFGDYMRIRFAAPDKPALGGALDLLTSQKLEKGREGVGSVHHIAFRARDAAEQSALAQAIRDLDLTPTNTRDRTYFKSIYFREPSGVLFEIATDGPGFAVDEPVDELGTRLCLPPALEPRRAAILKALPRVG